MAWSEDDVVKSGSITVVDITAEGEVVPVVVPGPDKEQDEQPEVLGIASVLQYVDQVQYWLQSRRSLICTDYR
jgi:hypothetical protein